MAGDAAGAAQGVIAKQQPAGRDRLPFFRMATVTVIIPNYNHARYLPRRIESVLNQTYRDFEVLLMDDCSTDDSREILAQYARTDVRIRLLLNETNSGSTFKQWNKGVRESKGKFIWIAESDDYADAQFLEILVARLEATPDAVLAYAQSWNVDEHDRVIHSWKTHTDDLDAGRFAEDFHMEGKQYILNFLVYKNTIPNASAVVFRRDQYLAAGGAEETGRVSSDWRFWIKLLQRGNLLYVSRELNYYRTHQNTVRAAAVRKGKHVLEHLEMIRFMFKSVKMTEAAEKKLLQQAGTLAASWLPTATVYQVLSHIGILSLLARTDYKLVRGIRSMLIRNYFRQS